MPQLTETRKVPHTVGLPSTRRAYRVRSERAKPAQLGRQTQATGGCKWHNETTEGVHRMTFKIMNRYVKSSCSRYILKGYGPKTHVNSHSLGANHA
jgi:hypothetical protein